MDYNTAAVRFGRIARHLLTVREDESYEKCHPRPDIDLCEKPASADKSTPIVIGSIVGVVVVGTLALLTFFHFRKKRMDEAEWPKNNQELEDYGFEVPRSKTRQPQNTAQRDNMFQQQQRDQSRGNAQHQASYQSQDATGAQQQRPARAPLDDLERSLRGGGQPAQTTGAFRRHEEQITADMKPVEPSDRI
ncbi:hypothetical protein F5Y17DRAFT_470923 [Xylariaceae sp. FL0594]|nr:hypothetical protein F5Y17DRAFT_470923 [Xylariaceae sp. FL0594]